MARNGKPGYFILLDDIEHTLLKAQQHFAEGRLAEKNECFNVFSAFCATLERFDDIPPDKNQQILEKLRQMQSSLENESEFEDFSGKLRSLASALGSNQ
ncbi:hypothetical protein HN858_03645 [Candidatus Falkowbacteria bacterium]|jgi:hypothetical protein|nr:hypothetical protein [Candidatus Falkowbacteria bacterium]MBT5503692.1 hypothetical protein [Candidatus Falkowbacteria bacterium]MBT6573828.1 hypothetical protein [Candidatus Falkowbacteria bacterium]MBT7348744.1 hypothetical protein [Candidatus Falkowbacteria bacterium]MBT7500534.1 hypothetical protein [Candidatus Falkowbacteria bacterium]